ncbi:hypothetical protein AB4304_14500 [Vibrio breoganii]|uniref:hypothetical protein n=1 Tax=Vibrio breoganii TaxID=553239 RepID=UPI000C845BDD|nr:hypothetical protein [Vibrio breoganii]PMK67548.1 hypothetical protein BCT94_17255 [Vibrio breoganii]
MTLFIHIGTHKTGTSTIQNICTNKNHKLAEEGIHYLQPSKPLKEIREKKRKLDDVEVETIRSECKDIIESIANKVFICWEGFSGYYNDGYKDAIYNAYNLKRIFYDCDVKVVIYLREHSDFIMSSYLQELHEGKSFSFKEYLDETEIHHKLNYVDFLEVFINEFGKENIIIRNYSSKDEFDAVHDIAEILASTTLRNLKVNNRINVGYKYPAILVSRLANRYISKEERLILRRILQSKDFISLPSYDYTIRKDLNKIQEGYRNQSNDLSSRFDIDFERKKENVSINQDTSIHDDDLINVALIKAIVQQEKISSQERQMLENKIILLHKEFSIGIQKNKNETNILIDNYGKRVKRLEDEASILCDNLTSLTSSFDIYRRENKASIFQKINLSLKYYFKKLTKRPNHEN